MQTDEIEVPARRRRSKRRQTLDEVGAQYTDKQTMQLTVEHLRLLNDLAEGGPALLADDTDELTIEPHDTQPVEMNPRILTEEDPAGKA